METPAPSSEQRKGSRDEGFEFGKFPEASELPPEPEFVMEAREAEKAVSAKKTEVIGQAGAQAAEVIGKADPADAERHVGGKLTGSETAQLQEVTQEVKAAQGDLESALAGKGEVKDEKGEARSVMDSARKGLAEASAKLRKFEGVSGKLLGLMRGEERRSLESALTEAKETYDKARAELVKTNALAFLAEKGALADKMGEEYEKEKGATSKIYDAHKKLGEINMTKWSKWPKGDRWQKVGRMLSARMGISLTLLAGGTALTFGGAATAAAGTMLMRRLLGGGGAAVGSYDLMRMAADRGANNIDIKAVAEEKGISKKELKAMDPEQLAALRQEALLKMEDDELFDKLDKIELQAMVGGKKTADNEAYHLMQAELFRRFGEKPGAEAAPAAKPEVPAADAAADALVEKIKGLQEEYVKAGSSSEKLRLQGRIDAAERELAKMPQEWSEVFARPEKTIAKGVEGEKKPETRLDALRGNLEKAMADADARIEAMRKKRERNDMIMKGVAAAVGVAVASGTVAKGFRLVSEKLGVTEAVKTAKEFYVGKETVPAAAAAELAPTDPQPTLASDGEVAPPRELLQQPEYSKETLQLATIQKGDGYWNILRRQLEARADDFGYDETRDGSLDGWSKREALRIGKEFHLSGKGGEWRLRYDANNPSAVVLEKDQAGYHLKEVGEVRKFHYVRPVETGADDALRQTKMREAIERVRQMAEGEAAVEEPAVEPVVDAAVEPEVVPDEAPVEPEARPEVPPDAPAVAERLNEVRAGDVAVKFNYGPDGKIVGLLTEGSYSGIGYEKFLNPEWRAAVTAAAERSGGDIGIDSDEVTLAAKQIDMQTQAYDELVKAGKGGTAEALYLKSQIAADLARLNAEYPGVLAGATTVMPDAVRGEVRDRPVVGEGAARIEASEGAVDDAIRALRVKTDLPPGEVRQLAERFLSEPAYGKGYSLTNVVQGETWFKRGMSKEDLMAIVEDSRKNYDENRAAQWALNRMGVETSIRVGAVEHAAAGSAASEIAEPPAEGEAGDDGHAEEAKPAKVELPHDFGRFYSKNEITLGQSFVDRGVDVDVIRKIAEQPASGSGVIELTAGDGSKFEVATGIEAKRAAQYALDRLEGGQAAGAEAAAEVRMARLGLQGIETGKGMTGRFVYGENGEVRRMETTGNYNRGKAFKEVLKPGWSRSIDQAVPRTTKVKNAWFSFKAPVSGEVSGRIEGRMREFVEGHAKTMYEYKHGLAALEESGMGNTPEAEHLRKAIGRLRTEVRDEVGQDLFR